jgi:ubiquinone/menaquinone biosynthesis C-methylase UbiE
VRQDDVDFCRGSENAAVSDSKNFKCRGWSRETGYSKNHGWAQFLKGPGKDTECDMDSSLQERMLEYYSERASEYDEIYLTGGGPISIPDRGAYVHGARLLSSSVRRFCSGTLIDIACGTAFWLSHYAPQCPQITLLDQSEHMLVEARKKVESLKIEHKTSFITGDFLSDELDLPPFQCALIGFFLSHLSEEQEGLFFERLRSILAPRGSFLILDSVWSEERARVKQKEGIQKRMLNNGRCFQVYKRYLSREDVALMESKYNLDLAIGIGDACISQYQAGSEKDSHRTGSAWKRRISRYPFAPYLACSLNGRTVSWC